MKEEPKAPNSAPQTPKSESKSDVKDLKPATPSNNQPKVPKKTWKAEELQQAFIPTLEKLLILEESLPFRQPVDAIALGIPVSAEQTVCVFLPVSWMLQCSTKGYPGWDGFGTLPIKCYTSLLQNLLLLLSTEL